MQGYSYSIPPGRSREALHGDEGIKNLLYYVQYYVILTSFQFSMPEGHVEVSHHILLHLG